MKSDQLETLCCPHSRGELAYLPAGAIGDDEALYCARSRRTYPITDGLPVLLSEEATLLDESTVAAIESKLAELKL